MEVKSTEVTVLPRSQKIFYGIGHIFNDLCANCWFSYALIYLTKIAGLSESNAGIVVLVGQLADALFTLIIGYSCDKTKITWYGKRKFWHGIGTLSVLLSFPFIFNLCISCNDASEVTKLIYYSAFAVVFQFGWAAVQIAHLALLPEITSKASQRVELNAIRSGFTFATGIFIFASVWLLLGTSSGDDVDESVSPQFMNLAFIVIGVGSLFSLVFHIGTKEEKNSVSKNPNFLGTIQHDLVFWTTISSTAAVMYSSAIESTENLQEMRSFDELPESEVTENQSIEETGATQKSKGKNWKNWLKDVRLYKTGLMYMCTRLAVNVFQSFFALYLTDALHFDKEAIAYFPLMVWIAGSVTSSFLKFVTKRIGSQLTYVLGAASIIGGCVWLFAVSEEQRNTVYGAAFLIGCGLSIVLVTSLAKTAELIGDDKRSAAFVYSTMSFTDKLSTGIVIFIIQELKPESNEGKACDDCEWFSKIVQTCVPGACAVIGLLAVVFLFPSEFTCVRKTTLQQNSMRRRPSSKNERDNEGSSKIGRNTGGYVISPDEEGKPADLNKNKHDNNISTSQSAVKLVPAMENSAFEEDSKDGIQYPT